uniref:Uncharacterized protein n=1 Tax=Candidatus Kentrum sp. TC TaxID=2126339 RepID=A0A451ADC9_9GAMM|nr:MAG: hypothetical protein BECKTC1821E_GA0114239_10638 [Candidatus Kentron sp. TC]VFK50862.1 MAG: hypothetical protein BECKTC1821D_GA0114238_11208 [Candidatus Kentron sp. TC]VFK64032.1 MAG: hypothetical protein BECKTC1821F_GA0114240_11133 [Candidatus Kentron sp. TC]
MSDKRTPKPFSRFETDQEAEDFIGTVELSEYDFSGFLGVRATWPFPVSVQGRECRHTSAAKPAQ